MSVFVALKCLWLPTGGRTEHQSARSYPAQCACDRAKLLSEPSGRAAAEHAAPAAPPQQPVPPQQPSLQSPPRHAAPEQQPASQQPPLPQHEAVSEEPSLWDEAEQPASPVRRTRVERKSSFIRSFQWSWCVTLRAGHAARRESVSRLRDARRILVSRSGESDQEDDRAEGDERLRRVGRVEWEEELWDERASGRWSGEGREDVRFERDCRRHVLTRGRDRLHLRRVGAVLAAVAVRVVTVPLTGLRFVAARVGTLVSGLCGVRGFERRTRAKQAGRGQKADETEPKQ